ncbi:MAG: hypothetical protein M3418_03935 [Gemmatimonadota bacterium]|nr:hypothetical protein [Gemmatimonadota bacterium]
MQDDRGSNVQGTDAGPSGGEAGARTGGSLSERELELRAKSMRKRENGEPEADTAERTHEDEQGS